MKTGSERAGKESVVVEGRLMTKEELQDAIKDATDDVKSMSSCPSSGPFPQHEVTRREMILLRQLTLYKIEDAKKSNRKDLERFNTEIYNVMTAFVKSQ